VVMPVVVLLELMRVVGIEVAGRRMTHGSSVAR
jgi:hypothetical protein